MNAKRRIAILLVGIFVLAGGPNVAAQTVPGLAQFAVPTPAPATPAPPKPAAPLAPAISAAQARDVLDTLNDPKKRAAFTATLEAITKALPEPPVPVPAAGVSTEPTGGETAAQPAPDTPAATPDLPLPLKPDSLGARLLVTASDVLVETSEKAQEAVGAMNSLPALWDWLVAMTSNPWGRDMLADTSWRLLIVFAVGLLAEYAVNLVLRRPRAAVDAIGARHATADIEFTADAADPVASVPEPSPAPHPNGHGNFAEHLRGAVHIGGAAGRHWRVSTVGMLRRLPLTMARLLLDLLPVVTFLVAAHLVLGTPIGGSSHPRLVLIAMVGAYAGCLTILRLVRVAFAPAASGLGLLDISEDTAAYAMRWARRLVVVTVFGYALGEAGRLLGLSEIARDALMKGVGLIDHIFVAIIVLQKRRAVRDWIRPPAGSRGIWAQFRNRIAAVWHWIALFYIAAMWLVWAVEIPDGFRTVLRIFVVTAAVMTGMRIVLILAHGSLDRLITPSDDTLARYPGLQARLRMWRPALHVMVDTVVYLTTFVQLLQVWGFGAIGWLTGTDLGRHVLSAVTAVLVTLAVAMLVWEAANHWVERHLARLARDAQIARAARVRTLLPMLRTILLVTILTVVALLILSEIGVNTAPLLAGAGVLGIAIGFGSQKLVQDVITGLFLLLENTMQVGDVVSLGGLTGTVEDLSVRAIRLRAEDGSVHVIPFSAVTTVTNMTRDFGHAVIEVGVAYKEDYDRVIDVMREIVAEMRREPRWEGEIRDELEVMGLNAFGDSSVMIKARIKCGPFGRWSVLREFNRRLKLRFESEGIEIPYPHQALVLNQPIAIAGRPAAPTLAPVSPIAPEHPAPTQPQVAAR
jgi:moderate conductance mechanosensitive channel